MGDDDLFVLETERLYIRLATLDDIDLFLALWNDPRVMAPAGAPLERQISRKEIAQKIQAQTDGIIGNLLVIELKISGISLGECFISTPDKRGVVQADIKLFPAFWGHRYGVEVRKVLLEYAFKNPYIKAVEIKSGVGDPGLIEMIEDSGGERVSDGSDEFSGEMRGYTVPEHQDIYRVTRERWEERYKKRGHKPTE
ncbi:MAG: GNAT family N-acetyltransferase [Anaerolineales bacterium]|nr:GNAT family N-acetyltransferase [Anaerolineales bacterium]